MEEYRERCRDELAKMTGFPKYDCSYKDIIAYMKERS